MDPSIMMMLASLVTGGLGAMGGKEGEFKSTYNPGQLSNIDDINNYIKSQMGGGNQDITQNQNYQQGSQWLNDLFNDPEFFKSFEAPLQRQFEEETVPGLANRFASMGSGGSTGSTAFRNQLGREGSNLSTNIAALRGGMQQQGVNQSLGYAQSPIQNLMNMMGIGLQPTQNAYQGPSQGGWGALAGPLAGGAVSSWGSQNNAGQHPSTGNGYGAGWDNQFRQTGVY